MKAAARLEYLEERSRVTELDHAELAELSKLLLNELQRRRRLPARIKRLRDLVDETTDRLSPADRLRELRRQSEHTRDRYNRLLEALDPNARAARLERELCAHVEPRHQSNSKE